MQEGRDDLPVFSQNPASHHFIQRESEQAPGYVSVVFILGWLIFLVGVLGCLGYWLNQPMLMTYFPKEPPIALLTAIAMLFLGFDVLGGLDKRNSLEKPAGLAVMQCISLIVPASIGLACFIHYTLAAHFDLSKLMLMGREGPLFPTVMTSTRILFASIALFVLQRYHRRNVIQDYVICILGFYLIYTSLFALSGHLLAVPLLYSFMVSIPASIGFTLLGVALLLGTLPYRGLLSPLMAEDKVSRVMAALTIWMGLVLLGYGTVTIAKSLNYMKTFSMTHEGTYLFIGAEFATVLVAILVSLIAFQAIYYRCEAEQHARKEALVVAALSESEKRFRNLAETSTALIWETDAQGHVVYWNPMLLAYVGSHSSAQEAHLDWAPYVRPEAIPVIHQRLLEAGQTGKMYSSENELWHAETAEYRWIKSSGNPMYGPNGEFKGIVGISVDIHDLKMTQQQLETTASQLLQSNQDLEQFAAVASHDLKAPLRKIGIFTAQIASEKDRLNPDNQDALERIQRSMDSMQSLIDDLLVWSKASHAPMALKNLELSEVIGDVLLNMNPTIQEQQARIQIGALCPVRGDKVQLEQLFQNLLENALKYQLPGQKPEITIEANPVSSRVCQVSVRDNGIGFRQDAAERIFKPFERLHGKASPYPGTGVGLSICKRIVERHHGTIMAESQEGHGSIFTVTLPSGYVPAAPATASVASDGETPIVDVVNPGQPI